MKTPPRAFLEGSVFVTGGGGYLARALYRRALEEKWPCTFTAIGRDDHKLARVKQEFGSLVRIRRLDILDRELLQLAMDGHSIVIHAAAAKYVDISESNVFTTIDVNIQGSRNVAMAALAAGIPIVVGLSTDKAANPSSLYGMTKAVMERQFMEANSYGIGRFVLCRYGNVIGSTGSVIEKWRNTLLHTNEDLKVTSEEMSRFWFPVDHAIDTILWATTAIGGSIVVPQMGMMRLPALADLLIEMYGSKAQWRVTGLRPGEKLHEQLFTDLEGARMHQMSGTDSPWLIRQHEGAIKTPYPNMGATSDDATPIPASQFAEWLRDAESR